MKPRRREIWVTDVWIAIGRLRCERGQWQGQVQIEFASGFVVVATWFSDDGASTGRLSDWRCEDESTKEAAVRREGEFARAIASALE